MPVMSVIGDPQLQSVYRHWLDQRQGRAMPRRADIDPLAMPGAVWPAIMIVEVVWQDDGPRFRYRRAGSVFWRALEREPTGLYLDEILPETAGYRDYVLGVYRETLLRRAPLYTENNFSLEGSGEPVLVKRVTLPLANDDGVIDMVMTAHVFEHAELPAALSRVRELREVARSLLDAA